MCSLKQMFATSTNLDCRTLKIQEIQDFSVRRSINDVVHVFRKLSQSNYKGKNSMIPANQQHPNIQGLAVKALKHELKPYQRPLITLHQNHVTYL